MTRLPNVKDSRVNDMSYAYGELAVSAADALSHAGGVRVICDSSVFAPSRMDLVRRLLIEHDVEITPEALPELEDLKRSPRPEVVGLARLLFPDGALNTRIRVTGFQALRGFDNVLTYYVNLLLARKQALSTQLRDADRSPAPSGTDSCKSWRRLAAEPFDLQTKAIPDVAWQMRPW
jgi:hypothetical protein